MPPIPAGLQGAPLGESPYPNLALQHGQAQEHVSNIIVSGASILAIKCGDKVLVGTDTICSYGNMSRFKDVERIKEVAPGTLLAFSGELSCFQNLVEHLEDIKREDWLAADKKRINAVDISHYVSVLMHHQRTQMKPYLNSFVVAGGASGKTYLRSVDSVGTTIAENYVATGMGMHLALPVLRNEYTENMTLEQGEALLDKCFALLFSRDCRANNKIQYAAVASDGKTDIKPAKTIHPKWSYQCWNVPTMHLPVGGGASW